MKPSHPLRGLLGLVAVVATFGVLPAITQAAGAAPSWLPKDKPKLGSSDLAAAAEGKPTGRHSSVKVSDGKAEVEVSGADPAAVVAAVEGAGGTVDAAGAGTIRASVPTGALTDLANDPAVDRVAPVRRYAPAVTSEGVAAIDADDWQAGGQTGAGVKVAVIDIGFKGYTTRLGTELPAGADVIVPSNLGTCNQAAINGPDADDHGTAVAEVVHDVAPAAQIHLICVTAVGDLAKVRQYIKTQGIKVVNVSLVSFAGRGDGQIGADADAIRASRVDDGVLWVAAAGNHAQDHFSFTPSGRQGQYCVTENDPASIQLVGADEFYRVNVPARKGFQATLRWDAWPVTSEDFDLFVLDAPGGEIITASADAQGGFDENGNPLPPSEPLEIVGVDNTSDTGGSVYLAVLRCQGATNPRFDLFFDADPGVTFEQVTPESSIAEPAASPSVLAVGASCYSSPGTIQPFSSRGPTIDGRVKPDLTGPDGTSTATFGGGSNCNGFTGTSAAAPHVAGAAALLLDANATLDPSELQTQLEKRTVDRGPTGLDTTFGIGSLQLGPVTTPTPPAGQRFTPAPSPNRILDTRKTLGGHPGKLNGNETFALTVAGVPADATAVVLNVTVAEPEGDGFGTVFPTGQAQPNSSNLNYVGGTLPSNQVVAAMGTGGRVSFFLTARAHLIVDVNGWFNPAATGGFTPLAVPGRALDTRGGGRLLAGGERELTLTGALGVPVDATAVALNVTAVGAAAEGFVTTYPTGTTRPDAANLTYGAGQTVPNAVTATTGTGGKVRFFTSVSTDLLVDVVGYYKAGSGFSYVPLRAPRRDLDTRSGNGKLKGATGTTGFSIQVGSIDGLPNDAKAAQLNVTVNQPTGGFVTVWPAGQAEPPTSSLNFTGGQTIPNSVLTGIGTSGRVSLRNAQGTAHLIADVSGYFV